MKKEIEAYITEEEGICISRFSEGDSHAGLSAFYAGDELPVLRFSKKVWLRIAVEIIVMFTDKPRYEVEQFVSKDPSSELEDFYTGNTVPAGRIVSQTITIFGR